ncbi:unnamed protein product [Staurois parvus]|uniref:Uncharacterized protein n=1 Tax=Staurois parvus TaxID=386267 RepID=A0ABN9HL71_9NEOB|nr:unnamed protein product [Staurois parvus]
MWGWNMLCNKSVVTWPKDVHSTGARRRRMSSIHP